MATADLLPNKIPFEGLDSPFQHVTFGFIYVPACSRGGVVIEALRYKPEGRGFETR
jgi:hypothetical protein